MADFDQILALIASGDIEGAQELLIEDDIIATSDCERRQYSSIYMQVRIYEKALEQFGSLEEPGYADLTETGLALFCLSKNSAAEDALRTSLLLEESPRAYYILSFVRANGKDPFELDRSVREEIVNYLTKATHLTFCGVETFLRLDEFLEGLFDHSQKEQEHRSRNLSLALNNFPTNRDVRLRYGVFLCHSNRDPRQALDVLSPLLKTDDPYVLWIAHKAAIYLKDFEQALKLLDRITPVEGNQSSVYKTKGDLYMKLGEHDSAIHCYNREIMAKTDGTRKIIGLFSRANANLEKGNASQAAKDASNAAQMCFDRDECEFHPIRVEVFEGWSDFSAGADDCIYEVCKAFVKGIDVNPIKKDSIPYGQLCYLFSKYAWREQQGDSDDYDMPDEWTLKACALFSHPILSRELSERLASEGAVLGAIEHHMNYFIWKYKLAQRAGEPLRLAGRFYGPDEYKPSKKEGQSLHKLLKSYLDAHLSETFLIPLFEAIYSSIWSDVLRELQMFKEMYAVTDLLSALSDSGSTWFDFAYSAAKLEKTAIAESAYRRCINLSSDSTGALHNLSLLVEKNDLKEAVSLSVRAYEIAPDDNLFKKRYDNFLPIIRFQQMADVSFETPAKFESLTLRERLYLGAILVACLSEDQKNIYSVEEAKKRLAPGDEYTTAILSHLWNNNILVIDPYQSKNAIHITADGKGAATLKKARWNLNVQSVSNMSRAKMLTELLEPSLINEDNHEEAIALWKEVAIEESLEYLQYKCEAVDLRASIAAKTREYFADLLEHYSTAQMYNIVYRAVGNAVIYQKEKRLSYTHAANLVPSNCKQYGDRAMAEGWVLKAYRRNFDLPQSIVSELLYNRLLAIGDAGFNVRPGSYPIGTRTKFDIERNEN